ncbi:zeta toxin family protein [Arthrobacter sp.]|uniref:zeta toxin family protein n=1 Tax=Arthrobacter sp. TaxID=1667 RepID=UPI003A932588
MIDADEFKAALLRQERMVVMNRGSNRSRSRNERPRESFFPMELASLVHEESSQLAQEQRRAAISQGTNIIVDTVLSSESRRGSWESSWQQPTMSSR